MVPDTGADGFILYSVDWFTCMVPIKPIGIKIAEGSFHPRARH